jgi:hypothetical protein
MPGFQVTDKPHFPSRLPCNTSSRRDYVLNGLGKLFSYLATEQFWEYVEKDGAISNFVPVSMILSQVCHQWRIAAQATVRLWSIFYVPRFMSTEGEISLVSTNLRYLPHIRQPQHPMFVYLGFDLAVPWTVLHALPGRARPNSLFFAHSERWRYVSVSFKSTITLPMFHTLIHTRPKFTHGTWDALQPWRALVKVVTWAEGTGISACFELLRFCPNLRHLSVNFWTALPGNPLIQTIEPHEQLHTLELAAYGPWRLPTLTDYGFGYQRAFEVLKGCVPNLKRFVAHTQGDWDTLGFLEFMKANPQLEHMGLRCDALTQECLITALELTPNLIGLTVHETMFATDFRTQPYSISVANELMRRMTPGETENTVLVPNLRYLDILVGEHLSVPWLKEMVERRCTSRGCAFMRQVRLRIQGGRTIWGEGLRGETARDVLGPLKHIGVELDIASLNEYCVERLDQFRKFTEFKNSLYGECTT